MSVIDRIINESSVLMDIKREIFDLFIGDEFIGDLSLLNSYFE